MVNGQSFSSIYSRLVASVPCKLVNWLTDQLHASLPVFLLPIHRFYRRLFTFKPFGLGLPIVVLRCKLVNWLTDQLHASLPVFLFPIHRFHRRLFTFKPFGLGLPIVVLPCKLVNWLTSYYPPVSPAAIHI